MEFEEILKGLRKRKGLSQAGLAREFNLSPGIISLYEVGGRKPSYEMLLDLADFFDVSLDYLTGHEQKSRIVHDNDEKIIAHDIVQRPELRDLFNAVYSLDKEDICALTDLLKRLSNKGEK